MDKKKFLLQALNDNAFKDAQWLIAILSIFKEDSDINDNEYKYKIKQIDGKYFFYDGGKYELLTESVDKVDKQIPIDRPIFLVKEKITVNNKDVPNLKIQNIETTVGRLIQNFIMVIYPFGSKIDYINHRFMPSDIEKIVLKKYTLDNPEIEYRDPTKIYFDEYDRYMDACIHLTNLNNLCVPALTYKALTPPPLAKSKLKELMEKYSGKLDDPVVLADIQKVLQQIDRDYIKGDRSEGFLISNKDFDVVRKKLFLMYGEVHGFNKNSRVDFLPLPLSEGIDYTKLNVYNNDARSGSYSRGMQTVSGGTTVKELLRASANLAIDEEDCHTDQGLEVRLTSQNMKTYYGLYAIVGNGVIKLNEKSIIPILNKTVKIRMPSYCRTPGSGLCSVCCGEFLSLHPNGLSAAVAETGNRILYLFMKAMHGKKLSTAKIDIKRLIR